MNLSGSDSYLELEPIKIKVEHQITRQLDPENIRLIWKGLEKGNLTNQKLNNWLIKIGYSSNAAKYVVDCAIDDHAIETHKSLLKIPDNIENYENHDDFYCYECHKPGQLEICANKLCLRTFHAKCSRKNPYIPISYIQPLTSHNNYKVEDILNNDEFIENGGMLIERKSEYKMYCTRCVLIKESQIRDPSMEIEEMGFLLKFAFEKISTWLPNDTYSSIKKKKTNSFSEEHFRIFKNYALKNDSSLTKIASKLEKFKYKSLAEFLADFYDIQHNIGVMFGTESIEFESTKHLISDAVFEISEIRLCKDCYRHSNEKFNNWFCKPCKITHQTIFVKFSKYPYWPAKILRHIGEQELDIRFFGKPYQRAVVSESQTKNLNYKHDKESLTPKLVQAMAELKKYQSNLSVPFNEFAFKSRGKNKKITRTRSSSTIPHSSIRNLNETEINSCSYQMDNRSLEKMKLKSNSSVLSQIFNNVSSTQNNNSRTHSNSVVPVSSNQTSNNENAIENNVVVSTYHNGKSNHIPIQKENYQLEVTELAEDMKMASSREEATNIALDRFNKYIKYNQHIFEEEKRNLYCCACLKEMA